LKISRIFYGWYIVAALFLIWTVINGFVVSGFTAFIEPLTNTFDWNYTQITLAVSVRNFMFVILMPVVGLLIDRWGARNLVITGIVFASLGLFLSGRINSIGQFYLCFILMGIGGSTCTATVPLTLAGRWFKKKLAFATGIIMSGGAAGGLLVPLVTRIIDTLGWDTAMLVMGITMFVVFTPMALIIRQNPEKYGLLPDGDVYSNSNSNETASRLQNIEVHVSARQALKSSALWHISLAFLFHTLVVYSVTNHIMPYLSTVGIARMPSSFIASALAVVSIAGRLSFGWFGDKFEKKLTASSGTIMVGLSLLLFNFTTPDTTWVLIPAVILFGMGFGGTLTLHSVLVKDCFGTSNLGTITGFSVSITAIGMIVGPPLTSWIFEMFGNYRVAWFILAGVATISTVGLLTLPSINTIRQKLVQQTKFS
jgi:MFS family permease